MMPPITGPSTLLTRARISRPASSTVLHVLRLVQSQYMAHNGSKSLSEAGTTDSSMQRRMISVVIGKPAGHLSRRQQAKPPISLISRTRTRSASASAQVVDVEQEDYYQQQPPSTPPDRPQTSRRPPTINVTDPPWTFLPPEIAEPLVNGSISIVEFQSEFEKLGCKSGQLAREETLERLLALWLLKAELSEWAWLSGQIGHMLAAAAEAGKGSIRPHTIAFGNSIRAYCLAILGQFDEAKRILTINPFISNHQNRHDYDYGFRGLTFCKLNLWDAARFEMGKAVRGGFHSDSSGMTNVTLDCFEIYSNLINEAGRHEDMVELVRNGGNRLRHFLVGNPETRKGNPRLANIFYESFSRLRDPAEWIVNNSSRTDTGTRILPPLIFKVVAYDSSRTEEALEIFRILQSRGTKLPVESSLHLIAGLFKKRREQDIKLVLDYTCQSPKIISHQALSQLLRQFSAADFRSCANIIWDSIERDYSPTSRDLFQLARLRANTGDVKGVIESLGERTTSSNSPHALSVLLEASINANDTVASERALDRLALSLSSATDKESLAKAFNSVLKLFAKQVDGAGGIRIFQKYLNSGLAPDVRIYTSLISLYANLRQPDNAGIIFEEIIKAGLEPDDKAWSAMINADVESGNWTSATNRWSKIPYEIRHRQSAVTNVVKAFVLLGAPHQIVLNIFRSIENQSAYLWALAIQSASDAGEMKLMRSLFEEMDNKAFESSDSAQPGVYIFSILLHGYLRVGEAQRAKAIYDELLRRNIAPTSVTYAMIINSFAKSPQEGGITQAQNFAMSIYRLVQSQRITELPKARGRTMENLLSPLVMSASRSGQPEEARRVFDLIAEQQQPSIPLYTQLLDAYRKANDIDSVYNVWNELFNHACKSSPFKVGSEPSSQAVGPPRKPNRVHESLLCMPLSIMIDAISKSGTIVQIREIWEKVRKEGFGFDAANYNHLCVALAKLGDVEGAFKVCENVLIKRHNRQRALEYEENETQQQFKSDIDTPSDSEQYGHDLSTTRESVGLSHESRNGIWKSRNNNDDLERDSNDAFSNDSNMEEIKTRSAFRPPNRRSDNRQDSSYDHNEFTSSYNSSKGNEDGNESGDGNEHEIQLPIPDPSGFVPSQTFIWRPYQATISILDRTLTQCEQSTDQRAWLALADEGEGEDDDRSGSGSGSGGIYLNDFGTSVKNSDGSIKKTSPRALVFRLNRRFSRTVALIMLYRKRQKGQR